MADAAHDGLMERIVLGDEAALRELYGLLAPRAYGIALKVLREPRDAEDVLQETFFEIWSSATRFDATRGPVEHWVATMVRTRALDRLRKQQVRERTLTGAAQVPATSKPTPEDRYQVAQTSVKVRAELVRLPDEQREALELAYFEGLSQREISERTNTPLGTVKTRMRLAMLKLADALPHP